MFWIRNIEQKIFVHWTIVWNRQDWCWKIECRRWNVRRIAKTIPTWQCDSDVAFYFVSTVRPFTFFFEINMKTSIKFKKKNIETLKECWKKLFDSADMYSRIYFDLDIRQSKQDLMKLKKSDLCDIIINTFILETQESVKWFMAYKFKQLQDDFEHYKNHGWLW